MDKFEYQVKLEEINKLYEKQEYEEAAVKADAIEWKRVRSVRTLCMVSEIYEAVGRLEDSKSILYRAYRRTPNSRQLLYRLTEVCVQTQEYDDAVEYYTEYVNLSPHDNSKYILKYEIYKGRGSSIEEQIQVLEELKEKEYTEQWAYELARLYDEAGMTSKCIAECDDLALWFHNGPYVVQALELKKKYKALTPEQQTIYDNPSSIVDMETKEAAIEAAVPTLDQEIVKELPNSKNEVIADSILMNTEKEIAAAVAVHKEEQQEEEAAPAEEPAETDFHEVEVRKDEEEEIPISVNTVKLQNELADNMRQILSGIKPARKVEILEKAPVFEPVAPQPAEEAPVQNSSSIDDLLTAATINLGKDIQDEIGDKSLRDYAAELAKREERTPVMTEAEAPEETPAEAVPETVIPAAAAVPGGAEAAKEEPFDEPAAAEEAAEAPASEEAETEEAFDEEDTPEAAPAPAPVPAAVSAPSPEPAQAPAEDKKTVKIDPMSFVHDELDEKECSMLGFGSTIRGMREQVNQAVVAIMRSSLIDRTSSTGNVILVGDAGNGRTSLALSIARIVGRCKGQQKTKAAKIYAEDLNSKDIAATIAKISGGVLIIEEAGDLSDDAIDKLDMAMKFKTDSLVVVLEDERRYMQELLARNPGFTQKFTVTINVPMLTNDELVEFGKYYANENDCVLDDTAVLTLYDGIGAMQNPEQPVAILDVKELMDKAIKRANKFSIGKMLSSVTGKRYDSEDRIIIKGKYFKKIK